MNSTTLHRTLASAIIAPALVVSTTAAFAATPQTAKTKPPVLTCKTATPEGLSYTVIKPGKGEKPGSDAKVKVNYRGFLKTNGTEFDAGNGTEFAVGGVIPGFSQGLKIMVPGAKYRLCIPSKLGYGEAATGPIPANSDLVFEVDLLSFTNPPPKPIVPLAERACDKATTSGLGYAMLKQGSGKIPTITDIALVDFTTFDVNTGIVGEKREWEKIPLSQASAVFSEALQMMPVGSSYIFCMPAPKTEGTEASGTPPTINIRVDLIDVRVAPPAG